MMKTYKFNYADPVLVNTFIGTTHNFDEITFCSEWAGEAYELFENWAVKEMGIVPAIKSIEKVYNSDDEMAYMFDENGQKDYDGSYDLLYLAKNPIEMLFDALSLGMNQKTHNVVGVDSLYEIRRNIQKGEKLTEGDLKCLKDILYRYILNDYMDLKED